MDRYEEDHWIRDWFDANEEMILLHDALCCRQIFRLIQSTVYKGLHRVMV